MTVDKFRALVLALPQTEEGSHMGHPDFRTGGKIFASLANEEDGLAMVKLTPEQQEAIVDAAPGVFEPCQGAWGMGGATYIHLKQAKVPLVRQAVQQAWARAGEKPARRRSR